MNRVIFVLIIIFAAFIRLFWLDKVPPALNWDEVSLGYNAYSILKSGKDEWGEYFPLSFRAYGDYKLPAYVYVDVPFIALFGLNEWGVRLPSVLAGIGVVIVVYLIIKHIASIEAALWGAFLIGITPWSLVLSRIGLEAHLALFLTTAGIYFFLRAFKNPRFLLLSAVLFGLTIFTYNSSRILTPLLVLLVICLYKHILFKAEYRRQGFFAIGIFLIFFAVVIPLALKQDSSARYAWTKILDEGAIYRINELRGNSSLPSQAARLQYNKATYFLVESAKNYLSHLDPYFLFVKGGSNYQFSIPGWGLFYPLISILFLYGLFKSFRKSKREYILLLGWLLAAILPAAITRDAPHALRSLMMIPPFIMFAAIGLGKIIELIKGFGRYAAISLIGLLLFINFYNFWQHYTDYYKKTFSWSWQYGYKEAVKIIKDNYLRYDQVIMTKKYGEPHEFILFYWPWDPVEYRNDKNLIRFEQSQWYWVDQFNKFYFINDWDIPKTEKGKWKMEDGGEVPITNRTLLITSPGTYPPNWKLLSTIYFLDGKPAFDVLEKQS